MASGSSCAARCSMGDCRSDLLEERARDGPMPTRFGASLRPEAWPGLPTRDRIPERPAAGA